jgi:RNA recognition motif-containing protein
MNIYVGNLAYSTTENELRDSFAAFGTVDSVRVISDRDSGRSKGFAFVEMADKGSANAAIKGLDGKEMDERAIKVNEARPREDRR